MAERYYCPQCGSGRVERRKTGKKMFRCEFCGHGFPITEALTEKPSRHMMEIRRKTGSGVIAGRTYARGYKW